MASHAMQARAARSTASTASPLRLLRQHPLSGYFILAFGLTWLWQIPVFGLWHQWVAGPWLFLCPTTAAFVMAWLAEGRAGMGRLVRSCLRWRIGIGWYLLAALLIPALYCLGLALEPGAIAAFRAPDSGFLLTYCMAFLLVFTGAPIGEEPGWRGFALPRLQHRYGALPGTLILGSLWGLWHVPYWLLVPGHSGAGSGLLGIGIPFVEWFGFIMGFSIVITWVQNHSHGSVLPAILFHAAINTAYDNLPGGLFPALFPPTVAANAAVPLLFEVGVVIVAVLIAVATRGHLGYKPCRDEASMSAS